MTALVDTGDIARMLGVTRATVTDRISKRADFPKPAVNLSQRLRKWRLDEVQHYLKKASRSR